jgi:hypothetical protein
MVNISDSDTATQEQIVLLRLHHWAIRRGELGIASAIATILQRRGGPHA